MVSFVCGGLRYGRRWLSVAIIADEIDWGGMDWEGLHG
jgi:hypothetical protein